MKPTLFKTRLFTAVMISAAAGLTAQASVPTKGTVTNDSHLYDSLSEVRLAKLGDLNFDHDLARLTSLEHHYAGQPKAQRVRAPLQRISKQRYKRTK